MKKASILMIIGPLFLLGLYVFPLWNIMLGAPHALEHNAGSTSVSGTIGNEYLY